MILKIISTGSRDGNCYALIDDDEILILDAGAKFKDIMSSIGWEVNKIKGVLLTHEHKDHTKSHDNFVEYGICTYGCNELALKLEKVNTLAEKKRVSIGRFKVTPFYVPHTTTDQSGDVVPCSNYGYLIEHENAGKILYITDLQYCPYSFKQLKINHMIIECNYIANETNSEAQNYEHRLRGHCSLDTYLGIIRENITDELKTVTAVHLSDTACDPDIVLVKTRERFPFISSEIADKGKIIEF